MKKFLLVSLSLAWICCATAADAKVVFLADPNAKVAVSAGSGSSNNNGGSCSSEGYTYTAANCSNGLAMPCPSDNTHFKICCPSGYKHTKEECVSNISTDNCYGYYKCN